jgi:hypothetical protein
VPLSAIVPHAALEILPRRVALLLLAANLSLVPTPSGAFLLVSVALRLVFIALSIFIVSVV